MPIAATTGVLTPTIAEIIAQDTIVACFNHQWEKVPLEQSNYFVKAYKNDKNTWTANGFNSTGKKQMTGIYRTEKLTKKDGHFVFFFKNGNIRSEGNFTNKLIIESG